MNLLFIYKISNDEKNCISTNQIFLINLLFICEISNDGKNWTGTTYYQIIFKLIRNTI